MIANELAEADMRQFFVPSAAVALTGDVKYFDIKGDSDHNVTRGFCAICGSQIFGKIELMPGLLAISAGSLDNPAMFKPSIDLCTFCAQHCDFMLPDLPKFPLMPPAPK